MKTIDVRNVPAAKRHPLIFEELEKLQKGEAMELVNDHDPKPLKYQLDAEYEGIYEWEYKESGTPDWKVIIRRVKI